MKKLEYETNLVTVYNKCNKYRNKTNNAKEETINTLNHQIICPKTHYSEINNFLSVPNHKLKVYELNKNDDIQISNPEIEEIEN
jgi:predicted patatin/cPLA2 family phospholipase